MKIEMSESARVPHSSVVSLGMPLGRECSPLLLHRTTLSEHVQTSGQPDEGRQPLSSTPKSGKIERQRKRKGIKGGGWTTRRRGMDGDGP